MFEEKLQDLFETQVNITKTAHVEDIFTQPSIKARIASSNHMGTKTI